MKPSSKVVSLLTLIALLTMISLGYAPPAKASVFNQISDTPTPVVTAPENAPDEMPAASGPGLFVAAWGNDQIGASLCNDRTAPCATIQQAITKATPGSTIFVTADTFYGAPASSPTAPIIIINKNINISGGWDREFTAQNGLTTLNGQNLRSDVIVNTGVTAAMTKLIITNSIKSGIENQGILSIFYSKIHNNKRNNQLSGSDGGGIYNTGTLMIANTALYNNDAAGRNGGGIYNTGTLMITNTALYNNATEYSGGAIFNTGSLLIKNSTIANNQAHDGGAIMYTPQGHASTAPSMVLRNVTISNNNAQYGSGIYRAADAAPVFLKDPILYNSIISNNSCSGTLTSANNNLIYQSDGCIITGAYGTSDPLLGSFFTERGYFPLLSGSPAIDAGSTAAPGTNAACTSIDQLGTVRPLDGDKNTVAVCDIGAYEADPNGRISFINDGSPQSAVVSTAFAKQLSVLVKDAFDTPIAGVQVTFNAPTSAASGTFANTGTHTTSATTNINGIATASVFTANNIYGSYLINAAVPGVSDALPFNLRNVFENGVLYTAPTGNNANSCLTPTTPCLTINGALNKAQAGNTIKVAAGTYLYATNPLPSVVTIKKSITLSGGWDTTFTNQNGISTIDGEHTHTVVSIDATAANVMLEQFIIKNGLRGIYNLSNNLTLNKSAITGNKPSGTAAGAGIFSLGSITINNSTISNNITSYGYGGGIASGPKAGSITINNSTISGNTATGSNGGGVWASAALTINNSTISGNSATAYGGGMGGYDQIIIYNSIIAGNTASKAPDCFTVYKNTSGGYNVLGVISSYCRIQPVTGDLFNVDPKLGPWAGGTRGYYPLLVNSPAIDAGNPAVPGSGGYACLTRDQRNVFRPQGSRCDIGAYEYKAP